MKEDLFFPCDSVFSVVSNIVFPGAIIGVALSPDHGHGV